MHNMITYDFIYCHIIISSQQTRVSKWNSVLRVTRDDGHYT